MVTRVPRSSISKNHSLRYSVLEANVVSFWSKLSNNKSRYVGMILVFWFVVLRLMYCLRYSSSHARSSDACHNDLLQGKANSINPPHCLKPGPCSISKMWMIIMRIIAVLADVSKRTLSSAWEMMGLENKYRRRDSANTQSSQAGISSCWSSPLHNHPALRYLSAIFYAVSTLWAV